MNKDSRQLNYSGMFGRIVSILESSRTNVVRSINTQMVTAYWLIGREIVEEIQRGQARAVYAKELIGRLSCQLNERFGKGFSTTNLKYFRLFYLAFSDRNPVGGTPPAEFATHCVTNSAGFMPCLGWSHYRVLMQVEHPAARAYYEREADSNSWSVRQLERQIHSLFFERLLKSTERDKLEKLTHGDVGQMQLYVNYFDQEICGEDDNPTVGLLLCTEKNDSMVRYILSEDNEQVFASKYRLVLPSKEELEKELRKERFLIEEAIALYGATGNG